MENEIILEGHRLEPGFSEVPGQWETIWLYSGSTDNKFNHTTIKNSKVGILTDGNQDDLSKLFITNTQIYNASLYGILGRATNIKAENLVINKTNLTNNLNFKGFIRFLITVVFILVEVSMVVDEKLVPKAYLTENFYPMFHSRKNHHHRQIFSI